MFSIARWNTPAGGKEILPVCWMEDTDGHGQWVFKQHPAPRPLYRLHEISNLNKSVAVVVEGEKCADVARQVFPEAIVTTASGGANAAKQTDWAPLSRFKSVVIWSDADEAGDKYRDSVAEILHEAGAANILHVDVRALGGRTPDGRSRQCPHGWDVADAIDEGWTVAELRAAADRLTSRWRPPSGRVEWPSNYKMGSACLLRAPGTEEDEWQEVTTGPFSVVGEGRNPIGSARGILLAWQDADGREQRGFVRRGELVGESYDWLKHLADRGFPAPIEKRKIVALRQGLYGCRPAQKVTMVKKTGWFGTAFVLPNRVIGERAADVLEFDGPLDLARYAERGSLDEWREKVAGLASGNNLLVLAISVAFAGPIVDLLDRESFGINLFGASSTGKSSALLAAGSVWGGGGPLGFALTWRATDNGVEAIASAHSGTFLGMDELGQLNPEVASSLAYMLGNGMGKLRAQRTGEARAAREWRVVFLSTGEIGLMAKVEEARVNRRAKAGTSVRFIDVPADGGRGLGLFEDCHGLDPSAFAQRLKSNAFGSYGTAGPAFVAYMSRLLADTPSFKIDISKQIDQIRNELLMSSMRGDGQVSRVADRLATVAIAGKLAANALQLSWADCEPVAAAQRCFLSWIERRGGGEAQELLASRRALRQVVEQDEARFQRLHEQAEIFVEAGHPIRGLLGYHWQEGEERVWAFTTSGLEEVLLGIGDFTDLVRRLGDIGVIRRGDGRIQLGKKIEGRKIWLYVVPHSGIYAKS
jgi:putative DNA primase/helicase